MFAPHATEKLAAIVAASEALARTRASHPRPLVPATQACPDCGAVSQIASPGPLACRACAAAAPKTGEAARARDPRSGPTRHADHKVADEDRRRAS